MVWRTAVVAKVEGRNSWLGPSSHATHGAAGTSRALGPVPSARNLNLGVVSETKVVAITSRQHKGHQGNHPGLRIGSHSLLLFALH